jgi:hypothetical protein
MRVDLRPIGIAMFLAAIALASCNGYGSATGVQSNPTGLVPSSTPTGPTPTPTPSGPSPSPSPTPSGVPSPTPTASGRVADIIFSGSFQFGAYEIALFGNDVAIVTQSTGVTNQFVPPAVASQFWRNLGQNLPVDKIPVGTCPKPTSAPTDVTTITYQDKTSGDVSCPGNNAKTKQLYSAVLAVEASLDLRSMSRRRQIRL